MNTITEYKTISFRVDELTYNALQTHAKERYLSLSAYIRKCLDNQLDKEETDIELHRATTQG